MATRRISARGARSEGIAGSTDPAGTTVIRRAVSVSRASGVTWPPAESSTVVPDSIRRASASVMMSKRRIMSGTIWKFPACQLPVASYASAAPPLKMEDGRSSELATGLLVTAQDRNIRQVPILLGVIETVAHHEMIVDGEADVINLDVHLPS